MSDIHVPETLSGPATGDPRREENPGYFETLDLAATTRDASQTGFGLHLKFGGNVCGVANQATQVIVKDAAE